MAKPNFIGIGAEKSGTTALWFLLRQHEDIFLYERKETLYFSRSLQSTPPHHYEWTLFKNYAGQRAVGEISPEYMRAPGVAALVRQALGPIKIIVCLREPTWRAFSNTCCACASLKKIGRSLTHADGTLACRCGPAVFLISAAHTCAVAGTPVSSTAGGASSASRTCSFVFWNGISRTRKARRIC